MKQPRGEHPPGPGLASDATAVDATRRVAQVVKKIQGVRRRLFLDRLLRAFFLDLLVFACIFVVVVIVEKLAAPGWNLEHVAGGLFAASLLSSVVRTVCLRRVSAMEAARAVDERVGLKERISSALYLRQHPDVRTDPEWERLLWRDGARHVQGASLRGYFPLRVPRGAWLLGLPIVLTAAIWYLVPTYDLFGFESQRQAEAIVKRDVAERQKELQEKLDDLSKNAPRKNSEEVKKLLEALRRQNKAVEKPAGRKPEEGAGDPKKQAMVSLSKQEAVLKKAAAAGKYSKLKKALKEFRRASLREYQLTRKLRKALKDGDLAKAKKELDNLRQDLDSLRDLARTRKLSPEELKKLQKLAEELSRLGRDSQALSALSKALSQAASSLSQASLGGASSLGGNLESLSGALESLQLSQKELEELARMADDLEMMQQMLELVKFTKEDLANMHRCPDCGKSVKPGGT